MPYENERNASLHKRLQAAVESGHARVTDEGLGIFAADDSLLSQFVANRVAGHSLFDGVRLYRGSKDPDVDAGTFDPAFKHTSPDFTLARSYAEKRNGGIGLKSKDTWGIGVLAEYALPPNAMFHRNFGVEASGTSTQMSRPIGVDEASRLMEPIVDALIAAQDTERDAAADKLRKYIKAFLYEVPLDSGQVPLRKWVVQLDEAGDASRLIDFEERGPVAEVLIDVIRSRKLAIDGFVAAEVASYLQRGGNTGLAELDTVSPGVSDALKQAGAAIQATLTALREQGHAETLGTVSEALAWRAKAHSGVSLRNLTNAGASVTHTDARIRTTSDLQTAVEAIERAYAHQVWKPKFEAFSAFADAALNAANKMLRVQSEQATAAQQEAVRADAFDRIKLEHSTQSAELDGLEHQHASRMSGSLFGRLIYRFSGYGAAIDLIEANRAELSTSDDRLADASIAWSSASIALKQQKAAASLLGTRLSAFEAQLGEFKNAGELSALGQHLFVVSNNLSANDWRRLVDDTTRGLDECERAIDAGLSAASFVRAVAQYGLVDGPARHRQQQIGSIAPIVRPAADAITCEQIIAVLSVRGEDATMERVEEVREFVARQPSLMGEPDTIVHEAISLASSRANGAPKDIDIDFGPPTPALEMQSMELASSTELSM